MALEKTWRLKLAAGFFAAAAIVTACGDDGPDVPEVETETETEIPGVDAPEFDE